MRMPSTAGPASSLAPGAPDVDEVLEEINRIASHELELNAPIPASARLVEDLALDSMSVTVLAVGLENRFHIRLNEEDAHGLVTVGDLALLVVRRAKEQHT